MSTTPGQWLKQQVGTLARLTARRFDDLDDRLSDEAWCLVCDGGRLGLQVQEGSSSRLETRHSTFGHGTTAPVQPVGAK
jgi:hypothetical protein